MDRGAWQATVHEITKVRHDLATKLPITSNMNIFSYAHLYALFAEMSIQVFCPFLEWAICFHAVKCHKLFVDFGD